MGHAILFIGWNRAHVGKEREAYTWLMGEGIAYLRQHEGSYFERLDMFGLTAHGGDLNGALILFGDRAKLDELRRQDHFEAFVFRMGSQFDRLGVVPGLGWDGIQAAMKRMNPGT